MRVEILYFSGCPNHAPAVDCVRDVLAQEDTQAEMVEVEVKDVATAQRIGFLGSPTIRVDGRDVELAARAERAPASSAVPIPAAVRRRKWRRDALVSASSRVSPMAPSLSTDERNASTFTRPVIRSSFPFTA